MSHILFLLVLAFIVWRSLGKTLGRGKVIQPEASRPASPLSPPADAQRDEIADVAEVVSSFLGGKGQELLGQAVTRALQEAKVSPEISRKTARAIEHAAARAASSKKAAPQAPTRQRAKYLLDGDGGYRQRTDRTARLQQSFRGKGLCSPR